jgi:4-hydroxy-tetrahydrodipicolinate reductase
VSASVVVLGAAGRMGRLVAGALQAARVGTIAGCDPAAREDLRLGAEPLRMARDLLDVLEPQGVIVDFSHADATADLVRGATERNARLVVGTTGQTEAQLAALREVARRTPVVLARNFSLGVNRLLQVLPNLRVLVDDGFDVECIETHHRHKRDAPSGTALALVAALGLEDAPKQHGRAGRDCARRPGDVGIHSVRMGEIAGEHQLVFGSDHEVVEIRHRALDRAAFVTGVVPAVRFVRRAPAGFYNMLDVMNDVEGAHP